MLHVILHNFIELHDWTLIFMLEYMFQENNKKYFKRSQLISKQQEVHKIDNGNNEAVFSNVSQQLKEHVTDNSSEHLLSRQEVIRRLRERGEPILLFGESEIEAFKRLRKCEILEPEVNKVKHLFICLFILLSIKKLFIKEILIVINY